MATVKLCERSFIVMDTTIFNNYPFVQIISVHVEFSPPRIVIAYEDTPQNHQIINECYTNYSETDPHMIEWEERNKRMNKLVGVKIRELPSV